MLDNHEAPLLNAGDIVQITNADISHYPCLVIVASIHTWGVNGYIVVPMKNTVTPRRIPVPGLHGDYERVGRAVVTTDDE